MQVPKIGREKPLSEGQVKNESQRQFQSNSDHPITLWKFDKKLLKMTIEIVDFPIKHGGSFHSYVSLPEGKSKGNSPGKFFFIGKT